MKLRTASTGGVKRKLDFRELPYAGKQFYLDIKSTSIRNKIARRISDLGGKTEDFLTKNLYLLITDKHGDSSAQNKDTLSGQKTSTGQSSMDVSSPNATKARLSVPMSRGRALLLKATQQDSTEGSKTHTPGNDILRNATKLGIRVEHAQVFLKESSKLLRHVKDASPKQEAKTEELTGISPFAWKENDDKYVIKFEDAAQEYRPVIKFFDKFPRVYFHDHTNSPFDAGVVLMKPTENRNLITRKKSQAGGPRGGYCETCDYWYTGPLREHLNGKQHQTFVDNEENFEGLDDIVCKLPNFCDFISKFTKSNTTEKADDKVVETCAVEGMVKSTSEQNSIAPNISSLKADHSNEQLTKKDSPTSAVTPWGSKVKECEESISVTCCNSMSSPADVANASSRLVTHLLHTLDDVTVTPPMPTLECEIVKRELRQKDGQCEEHPAMPLLERQEGLKETGVKYHVEEHMDTAPCLDKEPRSPSSGGTVIYDVGSLIKERQQMDTAPCPDKEPCSPSSGDTVIYDVETELKEGLLHHGGSDVHMREAASSSSSQDTVIYDVEDLMDDRSRESDDASRVSLRRPDIGSSCDGPNQSMEASVTSLPTNDPHSNDISMESSFRKCSSWLHGADGNMGSDNAVFIDLNNTSDENKPGSTHDLRKQLRSFSLKSSECGNNLSEEISLPKSTIAARRCSDKSASTKLLMKKSAVNVDYVSESSTVSSTLREPLRDRGNNVVSRVSKDTMFSDSSDGFTDKCDKVYLTKSIANAMKVVNSTTDVLQSTFVSQDSGISRLSDKENSSHFDTISSCCQSSKLNKDSCFENSHSPSGFFEGSSVSISQFHNLTNSHNTLLKATLQPTLCPSNPNGQRSAKNKTPTRSFQTQPGKEVIFSQPTMQNLATRFQSSNESNSQNLKLNAKPSAQLVSQGQMSTLHAYFKPWNTATDLSDSSVDSDSLQDSLKLKIRRDKQRHKKHTGQTEKTTDVYYSCKTSDTKIKLRKVVASQPQQKNDLHRFWKVRKGGGCRLIFSAEKRKVRADDDIEYLRGSNDPIVKNDSQPTSKRRKLIY